MKGVFNVVLFLTFVVAAMLHGSCAQTTHVVGDALGWTVPPGGDAAYRTWAANTTFSVGDVLVFNFATGAHDVAEVTTAAYGSCNSISPIRIYNNGPTIINLTTTGEHHFICTIGSHCTLGQRLSINVSSASAPSPQPTPAPQPTAATPSPSAAATPPPAAAPSPSEVGNTYTVGDRLGWTVPPGGAIAYQTWARTIRSFTVGDTLLFNFITGQHDVVEVTRAEFDSCNTTTAPITTGPARISLTSAGEHHYICTFGQHCSLGQRLAINVTAGGPTMTPPSSSPAGGPTMTPPSSSPAGGPTMTPPSSSTPGGPTMTPPSSSTPGGPSPVTAPPPPSNSAPSFAVAGLPFTFLTLALAFLV